MYRFRFLFLLFPALVFLFSCKSTGDSVNTENRSSSGTELSIPELLSRIERDYGIINTTILEHKIFSGVIERTRSMKRNIATLLLHLQKKKDTSPELLLSLQSLSNGAVLIHEAATASDLNKAQAQAESWQQYKNIFNDSTLPAGAP
jgi:hypothetical protein